MKLLLAARVPTQAREAQMLAMFRTIGDILVESGLISREDYLRRARGQ